MIQLFALVEHDPLGAIVLVGVIATALGVWRNQAVLSNHVRHLQANVDMILEHLLGKRDE